MDDTARPTAEFTFAGNTLTIMEPTDSQRLVLALSKQPAENDTDGMARLVRRLASVLESLMGAKQWEDGIEEPMIRGEADPKEFTEFALRVITHDFRATVDEPSDEPTPEELEMIRRVRESRKNPSV